MIAQPTMTPVGASFGDAMGRVTEDIAAIASGSPIGDAIDRIKVTYDAFGRPSVLAKTQSLPIAVSQQLSVYDPSRWQGDLGQ